MVIACGIPIAFSTSRLLGHRIIRRIRPVKRQVHQRRGHVFDRLEPHVEMSPRPAPCRSNPCGIGAPVSAWVANAPSTSGTSSQCSIQLAWQFDEIARDRGAADALIGHIRQHLVQRMAELVKQRARIVIAQKRRVALGEVAHVDHHRPLRLRNLGLRAHRRTPRARPLGAAREIIADEHRHMMPVARHLPRSAVGVVKRHVQRLEFQPEQPVRTGERRLDHAGRVER